MGLFSKKREAGEDAAPHPKDASPHPSATQTPSHEGEGFEARPMGELPTESGERGLECETSLSPAVTPHLKGEAIVGEDATPHPLHLRSAPSPEGEGTNRLLPREKLSAELTDEGVEESTVEGAKRVSVMNDMPVAYQNASLTEPQQTACPYEQHSNETVGADDHIRPQEENAPHASLEQMVLAEFGELRDIAPTLTASELLGSEDIASIGARLRRGYSLRDAYLLSQIKTDSTHGCSHLQRTLPTHRATASLPDDVLAAYSIFMPKASRAEIQKNYTDYLARTGKG